MKSKLLIAFFFISGMISYGQEHYYEADKIYLKKTDGVSIAENHNIAMVLNENVMTCTVRIDYKEPQIFKIVSEEKDVQTTVKKYELVHEDGRKITLSVKRKRIFVEAHATGKKFETDITYSKTEKV